MGVGNLGKNENQKPPYLVAGEAVSGFYMQQ